MKIIYLIIVSAVWMNLVSCEDFVQVDLPESQISKTNVFKDERTAEATINGIYSEIMRAGEFSNGTEGSPTVLCGLSSDELIHIGDDVLYIQFEMNSLMPDNALVFAVWESAYKAIYDANSAIEGLNESSFLRDEIKYQLLGEAYFIRAYAYFYLVNLYGDVPIVFNTNYLENSKVSRESTEDVWNFILEDLDYALNYLHEEYPTGEKVRPNKNVARSLLARVHLYLKDWENAEFYSTQIINHSEYELLFNLNDVFLMNSKEAIWQLPPVNLQYNTNEGRQFADRRSGNVLTDVLINAFEPGDQRLVNWTINYVNGDEVVFAPFKYKVFERNTPITEYSMVFRLAEIYLIRSEALAHQRDLVNAIADLDAIRNRAGLPLIANTNSSISQAELLLAIEQERRVELFTEGGHRWFDLKRNGSIKEIEESKPNISLQDMLYPIPQQELNYNSNLEQNPGY